MLYEYHEDAGHINVLPDIQFHSLNTVALYGFVMDVQAIDCGSFDTDEVVNASASNVNA